MRDLGIEFLSVLGLPPVEFVTLAADLGCRHISTGLESSPFAPLGHPPFSLREDTALRRELVAVMRDRGVSVSLGEGMNIRPGADIRDRLADLEIMAELGVRRVNTVSLDPELARTIEQFVVLAEAAASFGMETTVEPSPGLTIGDLPAALHAIRQVGRPDFRLLVDTMHIVRSGATPDDLRALDPALIGYIQLSDAPLAPANGSDYMTEAMFERKEPGTGELPLLALLAALPRDRILSLEVPNRAQAGTFPDLRNHLNRCVQATHTLLARL